MKEYEYYLFDADGTLFDTTELIYRCFENTASVFGWKPLGRDEVVGKIGLTLRDQMNEHFGPLTHEQFEQYRKAHMDYQLSIYREHLRIFPGVTETLACLAQRRRKCAVVSSRMMATLDRFLQETGIRDFFEVLVSPEITLRHKPDPEPAQKALELLGGSADRAIFVGDAAFDIECGSRAGTDTAFVLWSENDISLMATQPTYIIENMQELCGGTI